MSDPIGKAPRDPREELEMVDRFSARMLRKLRVNSRKAHWSTVAQGYLLARLCEELDELREELDMAEPDPQRVIDECADVANFAAMIADNARRGLVWP